jgi:hypothetical protein
MIHAIQFFLDVLLAYPKQIHTARSLLVARIQIQWNNSGSKNVTGQQKPLHSSASGKLLEGRSLFFGT